jgi:Uma2 family endonuclease
MVSPIRLPSEPEVELPTVPSAETWRAMTPEARLRFQVEVNAALSGPADLMSEGQPHKKAKSRTLDALGLHFRTIGRAVYLAEELSVLYPGEKPFTPDIFAVLEVEQPEDDERMGWVVAEEGKGLDLVIEVLHRRDRERDLVKNVVRYGRLGVSEYFVYDLLRQKIHGFRLPAAGATSYERIMPQFGHYRSNVLGLDLMILDSALRFLSGEAVLPFSTDLISRLQGEVERLELKIKRAQARVAEEKAQRSAAETQSTVAQAFETLQDALLMILEVRGISCPDEARERIQRCNEGATLYDWIVRAKTASVVDELFAP